MYNSDWFKLAWSNYDFDLEMSMNSFWNSPAKVVEPEHSHHWFIIRKGVSKLLTTALENPQDGIFAELFAQRKHPLAQVFITYCVVCQTLPPIALVEFEVDVLSVYVRIKDMQDKWRLITKLSVAIAGNRYTSVMNKRSAYYNGQALMLATIAKELNLHPPMLEQFIRQERQLAELKTDAEQEDDPCDFSDI